MRKENIYFDDIFELAEDIADLTANDVEASAIGSYEFIEELIKCLVSIDAAFMLKDINLVNPEMDGYKDKYLLEIDPDWNIYVLKIWNGNQYLISGTDVLFIEPNVDKPVYDNIDCDQVLVCKIGYESDEEDGCDGDCENCKLHSHENKLVVHESDHGLTQSWSSADGSSYFSRSFYSSNDEEMKKIKAEWNKFAQMF